MLIVELGIIFLLVLSWKYPSQILVVSSKCTLHNDIVYMCSLGDTDTCVILSVDPDAVPVSAREPVETKNITDPEEEIFGFVIEWNVPEPREFIDKYEVIITDQGRRSRRNEPMIFPVPSNENSYEFTTGTAYTDYLARVDALFNVGGVIGRVPALLPIPLQTAQGSELAQGHTLEFCSCTTSSLPLTFSLSPLSQSHHLQRMSRKVML